MRRFARLAVAAALLGAVVSIASVPADAAYPGRPGRIIFERGGDVWTVSPDGGPPTLLRDFDGYATLFTYAPDGERIAFMKGGAQFDPGVFVMRADGSGLRSVTKDVGRCGATGLPTWSPDGNRIAFACANSDFSDWDIWSIQLDGTGLRHVTSAYRAEYPAWSPSGDRIAFRRAAGGIYMVPATGGRAERIRGGVYSDIDWAPDASRLLVTRNGGEQRGIWLMNPDNGNLLRRVVEDGKDAAFSPNGNRIVYVDYWHRVRTKRLDGPGGKVLAVNGQTPTSPDWQALP